MRRALSLLAVTAVVLMGATVGSASAVGTEACTPAPKTDASFCVTDALALTQPDTSTAATAAAAPVDVTVDLSNTSTNHAADGTSGVWLKTIAVTLVSGLGAHVYTPSSLLPDGLILAGSDAGCAPGSASDFAACTDGNGVFYAKVSGTGGLFDGVHPGTFGIQKVVNVSQPPAGMILDWRVTAAFCLSTPFGACTNGAQTSTFDLTVPAVSGSVNGDTVTMPANTTLTPSAGVTVDASLDTVHLHLHGQSTQVSGGTTLPSPATALHLPTRCGTGDATALFTDRADTTVTVPLTQPVTGCPTARFTSTQQLRTAKFNGTTSTTPLSGRTITKWRWGFGDGKSKVTTAPTVAHTYASSRDRTVTLVVQDSLGALSNPRRFLLKGSAATFAVSATTVASGEAVRLSGKLSRWHTSTGLGGKTVRIDRCRPGATTCRLVKTVTTSTTSTRRGRFQLTLHPTRTYVYRATFFGGRGYLGVRKSVKITVT